MATDLRRRAGLTVVEAVALGKHFDGAEPVLEGVTFAAGAGEFVSVVGRSGSGKTTLLRMLAGLTRPTTGEVRVGGRRVDTPPPDVTLVFQDYGRSLFPWLSVLGNVLFPLRQARDLSRREKRERALEALAQVDLAGLGQKYPWQLSGGMQQRVALARALVSRPRLLLMDEPLASVDALTRLELQDLVLRVQGEHGARAMTVVHVTHDIDEAVYLSDRVLVLRGRPATLVAALDVDLPRPRDRTETRSAGRFISLRNEIYRIFGTAGENPAANAVAAGAAEQTMEGGRR